MNLEDLSVLLVDDDPEFRARTRTMIGSLGVQTVATADGSAQALAELQRRAFDVVICGHRVGIEGGMLRAIHQISPTSRTLLVSAYAPAAEHVARALGAAEVLEKPLSGVLLELALRRACTQLGGLRGEVRELSLIDILQMYHHGRQSVAVVLAGPIAGRICLAKGEMVHAEAGALRGLPALVQLLAAKTGRISTELSPHTPEATLQGSFQALVLEAVAQHDERDRRGGEATGSAIDNAAPRHASDSTTAPRFAAGPDAAPEPQVRASSLGSWSSRSQRLLALGVLAGLGVIVLFLAFAPGAPEPIAGGDARSVVSHLAPPSGAEAVPGGAGAPSAALPLGSFSLSISSIPAGASVLEHGNLLGQTPLTLEIPRASVAAAPRHFLLKREGYASYAIEQADSEADVRSSAVLVAAPAVRTHALPPPHAAPSAPFAAPPAREDLDIRLRR